jgi:hypothetical protein
MATVPRWFIPDGVPRPAHLPPGGISTRTGPSATPGLCVGGPLRADEEGWIPTSPGYFLHLTGSQPQQFLRMAPAEGVAIAGIADHFWLVPRLLRPAAQGLVCALPQVLTEFGFTPPVAFAGLMQRLRDLVLPALAEIQVSEREARSPSLGFDEAAAVQLAIDILAVNYHVSRVELIHLGWMTDLLTTRILLAAAGLVDDEASDG